MLLVKTYVAPSKIHGLGLFADEFIPKGTIMWEFEPGFDLTVEKAALDSLPLVPRRWLLHYAHLSKKMECTR